MSALLQCHRLTHRAGIKLLLGEPDLAIGWHALISPFDAVDGSHHRHRDMPHCGEILGTANVAFWQCAPKARITSGGGFHTDSCR